MFKEIGLIVGLSRKYFYKCNENVTTNIQKQFHNLRKDCIENKETPLVYCIKKNAIK